MTDGVGDGQRHQRRAATVAAYEGEARAYRDATAPLPVGALRIVRWWADALGPGARVLEVGSGSGRDAAVLEEAGLSVLRTDITPAFVRLLHEAGHPAVVLDPLVDDLGDPHTDPPGRPWDGVWAAASLLHADRDELAVVLARLAGATRDAGLLHLSLKEGDGEAWSTHGSVVAPRLFTYWREGPLRAVLAATGWRAEQVDRRAGLRDETWLVAAGVRRCER